MRERAKRERSIAVFQKAIKVGLFCNMWVISRWCGNRASFLLGLPEFCEYLLLFGYCSPCSLFWISPYCGAWYHMHTFQLAELVQPLGRVWTFLAVRFCGYQAKPADCQLFCQWLWFHCSSGALFGLLLLAPRLFRLIADLEFALTQCVSSECLCNQVARRQNASWLYLGGQYFKTITARIAFFSTLNASVF